MCIGITIIIIIADFWRCFVGTSNHKSHYRTVITIDGKLKSKMQCNDCTDGYIDKNSGKRIGCDVMGGA